MTLSGTHPILFTHTDSQHGEAVTVSVSVQPGRVLIDGVLFHPGTLRFLAQLAEADMQHLMSECFWVDCPEHKCEYTMSHTRDWCYRPTCREA